MLRQSLVRLSSAKAPRTIIRDPRKKKVAQSATSVQVVNPDEKKWVDSPQPVTPPVPFAPSEKNQDSVGSTLGSYVLAGVGVTLGFTLVKVVFGV